MRFKTKLFFFMSGWAGLAGYILATRGDGMFLFAMLMAGFNWYLAASYAEEDIKNAQHDD